MSVLVLCTANYVCMVPTRTGKQGKPGKWEGIFQSGKSQGILSRLEKSGKFTGKIRKDYTGKLKKKEYWKSQGNLSVTVSNSENPVNEVPYFK